MMRRKEPEIGIGSWVSHNTNRHIWEVEGATEKYYTCKCLNIRHKDGEHPVRTYLKSTVKPFWFQVGDRFTVAGFVFQISGSKLTEDDDFKVVVDFEFDNSKTERAVDMDYMLEKELLKHLIVGDDV